MGAGDRAFEQPGHVPGRARRASQRVRIFRRPVRLRRAAAADWTDCPLVRPLLKRGYVRSPQQRQHFEALFDEFS